MASDMFGSPVSALGLLMTPQEVQVAEDSDDGVSESEYQTSLDTHLMFKKPYHLISTESIVESDDEFDSLEGGGGGAGRIEEKHDYALSVNVLIGLSTIMFANLSIVLPSNLLYLMSLMDKCEKSPSRQKGLDGDFLVPLQQQPADCLDSAMYLFAASISLLTFFQFLGGVFFSTLSKYCCGGKKALLVVCLLISTLGNFLYAIAPSAVFVLLGRSVVGFSMASINLCFSYIPEATRKDEREKKVTEFRMFGTVGLSVGALVSFLFSFIRPPHNSDLSFDAYTGPAFILGIASLVGAILVLVFVKDLLPSPPLLEVAEKFFFSSAAILSLCFAFAFGFLSSLFDWMISPLCAFRWEWGVTAISLYFTATCLILFPAGLAVKKIKKKNIVMKIGDRFFLFVSWALMPLGVLLLWLSFQSQFPSASSDEKFDDPFSTGREALGGLGKVSGYIVMALGSIILFVSFTWGSAAHLSTMSAILPPQARERMMALGSVAMYLGRCLGPVWGAYAYSVLDYQPDMMFGLLSDVAGLSLVFCLILWKQLRKGSWMEVGGSVGDVSVLDAELDAYPEQEDLLD
mmetsp:Transcript_26518/g.36967  ORF Transcript_26518/g.36967 Transcript_26518/m.36967 type:complete len:574 (+) Transcript_26518:53-1774(+)|eukprot:CAMPEP_0201492170 /NCGR_PEP_ID=MMETSP0151_2-20130828/32116_1 /ASSEMBLY_ACC=CAM_ASM_000257 /TAXON_ID=200890 /ORGANISM="Paramoeba atlantica, Strain 621/1 / CCAP 1560/9" /LENGTH=573 /DNA_ID=CAMNT_0047878843 /DNA_START=42 /DNA_END=1763 /DNA_ORIENTATION=+